MNVSVSAITNMPKRLASGGSTRTTDFLLRYYQLSPGDWSVWGYVRSK